MSSQYAPDNVISLASARSRQHSTAGSTSLLQVSCGEVHRQLGVDASMSLADLHDVLDVAFGFADQPPWHFETPHGVRLESASHLGHHLSHIGDVIFYIWGLWRLEIYCFDSYARDDGTPRALCIGGVGGFTAEFDHTAINAELTGTDTIYAVLATVRPEVVDLVDRSGVFDFIPLLQALDLRRAPHPIRRTLPVENSALARDAFWSCVLALSCLGDATLFDGIITAIMDTLGWVADDGQPLTAAEITAACADSLAELSRLGGYGSGALAPVEKLEIYRELLRS